MTGGQTHEGGLTVPVIARQVRAEGVDRIAIVTDEPFKYPANAGFPEHVTIHHRSELQSVQKAPRQERIYVAGEKEHEYERQCRELGKGPRAVDARDVDRVFEIRQELAQLGFERLVGFQHDQADRRGNIRIKCCG